MNLKNALTLSSIAGLSVLVLTIIYDTSYFLVVEPNLMKFFDLSDYIANAISWFPAFMLCSCIGMAMGLENFFADIRYAEKQYKLGIENPKKSSSRKFSDLFWYFIVVTGITGWIITSPSDTNVLMPVNLAFTLLIMSLSQRLLLTDSLLDLVGKENALVCAVAITIIIMVSSAGFTKAQLDMRKKTSDYSSPFLPDETILLLRSTQSGMIVRRVEKNIISVINSSGTELVTLKLEPISDKTRLCDLFGIWCQFNGSTSVEKVIEKPRS
ncbi:MAG: hypothetical protein QM488_02295 [Rhizobiaceae bacterium]